MRLLGRLDPLVSSCQIFQQHFSHLRNRYMGSRANLKLTHYLIAASVDHGSSPAQAAAGHCREERS
jgi:hypothetical protein